MAHYSTRRFRGHCTQRGPNIMTVALLSDRLDSARVFDARNDMGGAPLFVAESLSTLAFMGFRYIRHVSAAFPLTPFPYPFPPFSS